MSGEPEDCDCGPEEPPDPEPGCGPQGCQSPNVYKYLLTQPDGPGTCVVCGTTPQCVPPDTENAFDTLELCCDTANDSNEQIDPPCPSCVVPECVTNAEFVDITSTVYPPGTACSSVSGWKTWNPVEYGCQWYVYLACPPGCINEPFPDPLPPEYQEGGMCCDPALGYTGCEEGVDLPCLCPDGTTGLSTLKPVISDKPCIDEDCNKSTATWIGNPVGEEVVDGLYRLEWDLIDDCPGACCTEAPKEPELGNATIFVNTPCKCNCQEG